MPSSQTRKKGQKRNSKPLGDLEWLRNPQAMLERAHSFEGTSLSDEEFFRFFDEMGENWRRSKNKTRSRNKAKQKSKNKSQNKK
jgi:hypothetical protein